MPPNETVSMGEWELFETLRSSDLCDYRMTCTFVEPLEDMQPRPFWMAPEGRTGNYPTAFYLSQRRLDATAATSTDRRRTILMKHAH